MHRFGSIPDSLHSEETGRPFKVCSDCKEKLSNSEQGYVIQKVISKGETILELAVCHSCHENLQQEYSSESKERIWNFYLDHGDLHKRLEKFSPIPIGKIDPWINNCLTCKATKPSCDEYAIAVHCIDEHLIYGETPLLMCSACMDKIMNLLSEESLGTYDEWLDRCTPMAPAQPTDSPRKRIFL